MVLLDLQQMMRSEETPIPHPLGNGGSVTIFPESEEEISTLLTYANKHNLRVGVEGGGTKRGYGGSVQSYDILVSMKHFRGIVEYSVGDMTMTVRPGTTMKDIADYLMAHKQRVAIDPKWPEYATIGGVVAANDSGPKRLRYGSARDSVIGLRVVYPDGKVIRTGGKVVKNVAGYDMNKLFIGSMGTLGIISEVTLKLRPLPKQESLVLVEFQYKDVVKMKEFASKIQDTTLEPVSLELLSPYLSESLQGKTAFTFALSFEDGAEAVDYQEEWLMKHKPSDAEITVLRGQEAAKWWEDFSKLAPNGALETDKDALSVKIGSKNLDAIDLVHAAHQMAISMNLNVKAHGGAGHGITRAYVEGNNAHFADFVGRLRAEAEQKGGYLVVDHLAYELRQSIDCWGHKVTYVPLMAGIKQAIDPKHLLNDKRFAGGV